MKMSPGGPGGPTILDLQSGALVSRQVCRRMVGVQQHARGACVSPSELSAYANVVGRVGELAKAQFDVRPAAPHVAHIFSRIWGEKPPITGAMLAHIDLERMARSCSRRCSTCRRRARTLRRQLRLLATRRRDGDPRATHLHGQPRRAARALRRARSTAPRHPRDFGTRLALTIAFTCDERALLTFCHGPCRMRKTMMNDRMRAYPSHWDLGRPGPDTAMPANCELELVHGDSVCGV